MPRHSLLAALVLLSVLAACARATQEEGWLVYGDPIPFVLFPQLPEPPFRFMNGSEISADPDAPLCASAPFVDIVRLVRVRLARADLPSLQLGLPFGYAWLAQGEHEGFRQTGEAWGGLLGFVRKDSVGVRLYGLQPGGVDDIAFWLGPRPGYPTSGLPPGTIQTRVSECRLPHHNTTFRLVRYATRSPAEEESETAAAYWVVNGDVVLSAAGTGTTPDELDRILAVMHHVQLVPRAR